MGNLDIVTLAIIGANVAFSLKGFNDYRFFEAYRFNIAAIRRGEYIRFLSSGFLHVNGTHLFFNMLTFYFFAGAVQQEVGIAAFLLLYFASLIGGNLLAYYFHKDEYHYNAVGASGAVTGVLYAFILFFPQRDLYLMFIPIPIDAWIVGVAFLVFSIYGMKKQLGNIGHDAHFGGAVVGYVLTLLYAPYLIEVNQIFVILLAIPIVLLFILIKRKLL
ncbi:MAG: rhomboid family intramembrane serine protease [Gilvibacter sp.]